MDRALGEFQSIAALGLACVTLWAIDNRLQRITFYTLAGGLLSSVALKPTRLERPFGSAVPFARLGRRYLSAAVVAGSLFASDAAARVPVVVAEPASWREMSRVLTGRTNHAMIYVYLEDEAHIDQLREALGSRPWKRLQAIPTNDNVPVDADAYVLFLGRLEPKTVQRLHRLRAAAPLTPTVLCTTFDRSIDREIGWLPVERVVWLDDPPPALTRAITDVLVLPPRYRIGESILRSGKVSGRVYDALRTMLCADECPARTTAGLARFIGCSKSSLERDWRAHVLPLTGLHVHEMLQWVLLLEAHERNARGTSWKSAASQCGVSYKTLRKAATDAVGLPIDDLAKMSEVDLNLRFASKVTRLLLTLQARHGDTMGG